MQGTSSPGRALCFARNLMWLYNITTRQLLRGDGSLCSDQGYSGHGPGLNNPELVSEGFIGPLPPGLYNVGQPYTHPKLGPLVMNLIPFDNQMMFGRNEMRIHGDEIANAGKELASDGCLVEPHDAREEMATSADRVLKCVTGL